MSVQNNRLGIWLMLATVLIFACQDAFARLLGGNYPVVMIIMIRFWVMALVVLGLAASRPEGFKAAVRTKRPWLQTLRAFLLVAEICVMVYCFTQIGLINSHAIFASCPLMIAGLAVPLLGEKVGWRRWLAIFVGFVGVIIILSPSEGMFTLESLMALLGSFMFALYSLLTRMVSKDDAPFVSFFWSGVLGAAMITLAGAHLLQPMQLNDFGYLLVYSGLALSGHYLLTKCYDVAEASAVQPFAYLQIFVVALIAVFFFNETLQSNVVIGGMIVVGAGVFTLLRARKVALAAQSAERKP